MTDVILQRTLTSASARFPHAFKTATRFSIGYRGLYRGSRDTGYLPFYFQGYRILSILLAGIWDTMFNFRDQGFFFSILGRGPRAFQIGKISAVNH